MGQYSKDTITGFSIPILKPPSLLITLFKSSTIEQVKKKKKNRGQGIHMM